MAFKEGLCKLITGTIFLTEFGKIYKLTCQGAKGLLVALQAITDCLLTLFFGYYELVLRGETCPRIMGIGKIRIVDFVAGEIAGSGSIFWRWSLLNLILNGS